MNNVKKIKNVRVLGHPIVVGDTAIIQKSDTLGSYVVEQTGVETSEGTVNVVTAQLADSTSPSEAVVPTVTAEQEDSAKRWYEIYENGSDIDPEYSSIVGPALPPQQPQAEPTKKKSNGVLYGIIAAVVAIILINN